VSEPVKTRLLAVDDNSDSAELIARVAAKCGYEAQSIADPRSLQQKLNEWKPEILTLDLCMPQEDGVGLLSLLEESGFDGQLVIISGQDDWIRKTARRLAAARGLKVADDMGKPVNLKELRQLLTNLRPAC
jgi:two-component system, chemotaxis family, chemotaxis protein CheY